MLPKRPGKIMARRGFYLRYVALACSLLLALPPGWCCYGRGNPSALPEDARTEDVCPCCRHTAPAAPEDRNPERPAQCSSCPCDERQATSIETAAADGPD